jgi:hypothetical protein
MLLNLTKALTGINSSYLSKDGWKIIGVILMILDEENKQLRANGGTKSYTS